MDIGNVTKADTFKSFIHQSYKNTQLLFSSETFKQNFRKIPRRESSFLVKLQNLQMNSFTYFSGFWLNVSIILFITFGRTLPLTKTVVSCKYNNLFEYISSYLKNSRSPAARAPQLFTQNNYLWSNIRLVSKKIQDIYFMKQRTRRAYTVNFNLRNNYGRYLFLQNASLQMFGRFLNLPWFLNMPCFLDILGFHPSASTRKAQLSVAATTVRSTDLPKCNVNT